MDYPNLALSPCDFRLVWRSLVAPTSSTKLDSVIACPNSSSDSDRNCRRPSVLLKLSYPTQHLCQVSEEPRRTLEEERFQPQHLYSSRSAEPSLLTWTPDLRSWLEPPVSWTQQHQERLRQECSESAVGVGLLSMSRPLALCLEQSKSKSLEPPPLTECKLAGSIRLEIETRLSSHKTQKCK